MLQSCHAKVKKESVSIMWARARKNCQEMYVPGKKQIFSLNIAFSPGGGAVKHWIYLVLH